MSDSTDYLECKVEGADMEYHQDYAKSLKDECRQRVAARYLEKAEEYERVAVVYTKAAAMAREASAVYWPRGDA
jgi:hypothetical protein